MELSGPFFKHGLRHKDVEDITLVTNDLGWTIKQQQNQEYLFKSPVIQLFKFIMTHREHFNPVSTWDHKIGKRLIFQLKW